MKIALSLALIASLSSAPLAAQAFFEAGRGRTRPARHHS